MSNRAAFQKIFSAANSRLYDMTDSRCREVEYGQTRALKAMPRPQILRELVAKMKDEPAGPRWKERCHHTLRRLHVALLKEGERPETLQIALNGYLDGQTELAAKWLTLEVMLRPWGVH